MAKRVSRSPGNVPWYRNSSKTHSDPWTVPKNGDAFELDSLEAFLTEHRQPSIAIVQGPLLPHKSDPRTQRDIRELASMVPQSVPRAEVERLAVRLGELTLDSERVWSGGKNKSPARNAYRHFRSHGSEFNAAYALAYVAGVYEFLRHVPPGTLVEFQGYQSRGMKPNLLLYNEDTNTFVALGHDGVPRTCFKPEPGQHGHPTNLDFFWSQVRKNVDPKVTLAQHRPASDAGIDGDSDT